MRNILIISNEPRIKCNHLTIAHSPIDKYAIDHDYVDTT